MISEILTAARIQHRRGRFLRPPQGTYAVIFDDMETEGPDRIAAAAASRLPRICHHTARIELYEPKPDDTAETDLEAELNARQLPWTKEDRYWIPEAQAYQVIYEFTYTEKI